MLVGVLLSIDIAILTTWQIIDPFFRETKLLDPYVSYMSIQILVPNRLENGIQSQSKTQNLNSFY